MPDLPPPPPRFQAPPKFPRPTPSARILFKPIEGTKSGGCHMDVYLPAKTDGAPIALMIHGGGFTMGPSTHIPPDQVEYLVAEGFAVISPEYRLAPHVRLKECREDVLDAYKYILSSLNPSLSLSLDTSRIITLGWSAGGSACIFLAADIESAGLQQVKAMVPTYPATDFSETANPYSLFEERITEEQRGAVGVLMGEEVSFGVEPPEGDHGEWPRAVWMINNIRLGTLNAYLINKTPPFASTDSPLGLCTPTFPPTFIVVATGDKLLSPSQSYKLFDKLKELGVEVEKGEAIGMPHGIAEAAKSVFPPGVKWWEEAILPSLEWVVKKGRE